MSNESIRLGVISPKIPIFHNEEAESFMVGDLSNGGVGADMLWHQPTSRFPELLHKLDGLVAGNINPGNFAEWDDIDIKAANITAAWDSVVTTAIGWAALLDKPVFTKVPVEHIGFYNYVGNDITRLDVHFRDRIEQPYIIDAVDYITIARGAEGASQILDYFET